MENKQNKQKITYLSQANSFADQMYKAYQLDWMMSQGIGLSDLKNVIMEAMEEVVEDGCGTIGPDGLKGIFEDAVEIFEDSLGFGCGGIYVCRDEFAGEEFQDRDYAERLLGNMPVHVSSIDGETTDFVYDIKDKLLLWEQSIRLINEGGDLYAVNIEWDTDGEDISADELPKEIRIPDPEWDEEEISKYITETVTGFCHRGFGLDVKAPETGADAVPQA